MTRDKDRKRIIRTRMKTTGESYTTARRHLTAPASQRRLPAVASRAQTAVVDPAAVAGMSDDKIRAKTGRAWQEWVRSLDGDGAAALTHGEIACIVRDKYSVPAWWSQTVTVGYERLTGRRERGQRVSGAYEVGKSKTFNVPVATLFGAWADEATRRRWLTGIDVSVRTATAPKSMRLQWPDGAIVAVWFSGKGPAKSAVALAHTKVKTRAAMEHIKKEWATRLEALSRLLAADNG